MKDSEWSGTSPVLRAGHNRWPPGASPRVENRGLPAPRAEGQTSAPSPHAHAPMPKQKKNPDALRPPVHTRETAPPTPHPPPPATRPATTRSLSTRLPIPASQIVTPTRIKCKSFAFKFSPTRDHLWVPPVGMYRLRGRVAGRVGGKIFGFGLWRRALWGSGDPTSHPRATGAP